MILDAITSEFFRIAFVVAIVDFAVGYLLSAVRDV